MAAANVVDERTRALVQPSSAVILRTHIEPTSDIAAERLRTTFNVEELSLALNGGKEELEKR